MPASTSSKTSVALPSALATPISASMTRDSSPPDAISRSGPAGTPAFGAMRNSTASAPDGPGSRDSSATSKLAPAIARSASRSRTAAANRGAASARAADSSAARCSSSDRAASSSAIARSSATSAPASSSRRPPRRALPALRPARLAPRHRPPQPPPPPAHLVAPRAAALGVGQHRRDRAAVLALQPLEDGQALLGGVERAGLGVEPLGVAAQLARHVVGLVLHGAPALGEHVERRVDARHPPEPPPA